MCLKLNEFILHEYLITFLKSFRTLNILNVWKYFVLEYYILLFYPFK